MGGGLAGQVAGEPPSAGLVRTSPPSLVMVLAFVALAFLLIPLAGLLQETPWSELPELLASPTAVEALRLSLVTSILAAAVATILGVPPTAGDASTEGQDVCCGAMLQVPPRVLSSCDDDGQKCYSACLVQSSSEIVSAGSNCSCVGRAGYSYYIVYDQP